MKAHTKRIQALTRATKAKKAVTLDKANTTISYMQDNNLAINFNSVAEVAGISKTWLYQHPRIRAKIEKLRVGENNISYEALHNKYTSVVAENSRIKKKNERLENQVHSLKQQLEVIYGELYKLKKSS